MHSRSIAHCDIKSENILLDFKFNLKLVDFGCARQLADELCRPIIYQNSSAVGSIKCNAPELLNIMGKGTYQGDEVDIFAAGCFLFELVMKA
jgi:serine/threonine protein kinase